MGKGVWVGGAEDGVWVGGTEDGVWVIVCG